ncbi:hypothetical protein MKEN_01364900 [Mycena kentingensis (nom. inval.)]|nr:hypothetical protein MKEN_01364900 [Mycena kentingensis (nom. inval.)]
MAGLISVLSGLGDTTTAAAETTTQQTTTQAQTTETTIQTTTETQTTTAPTQADDTTSTTTPTPTTETTPTDATTAAQQTTTAPTVGVTTTPALGSGTTAAETSYSVGGITLTNTDTQLVSGSPSSSISANATSTTSTDTAFWHNKGAVAGVFTVVGIIALVGLFYLTTCIMRRRRAARYEAEMDEVSFIPPSLRAIADSEDAEHGNANAGGLQHGPSGRVLPSLDHSASSHAHPDYGAAGYDYEYGYPANANANATATATPQHGYNPYNHGYPFDRHQQYNDGAAAAATFIPSQHPPALRAGSVSHTDESAATSTAALVPSNPPTPPKDYFSNYALPAAGESEDGLSAAVAADEGLDDEAYGGVEKRHSRVLKVANE